jgi:type II secretory pathway component PulJ
VSTKDPVSIGGFVVASLMLAVTIIASVAAMASRIGSIDAETSMLKQQLSRIEQRLEAIDGKLYTIYRQGK